jgi:protein associated with RNAse G/E
MISRDHYSSNNFQDSNKRKSTEKNTLGYFPKVFFFNVFELGTESGNQVFLNEALRSIAEVFSTMN